MKPGRRFRAGVALANGAALVSLVVCGACGAPGEAAKAEPPRAELRVEGAGATPLVLGDRDAPRTVAVEPAAVLRVRGTGACERGLALVELEGEISVVCEGGPGETRQPRTWKLDARMEPADAPGDASELYAEIELDLARYAGECGEAGAMSLSGWVQVRAVDREGAAAKSAAFFFRRI